MASKYNCDTSSSSNSEVILEYKAEPYLFEPLKSNVVGIVVGIIQWKKRTVQKVVAMITVMTQKIDPSRKLLSALSVAGSKVKDTVIYITTTISTLNDELVINQKDFPDVTLGDVLEIYHPDKEDCSHLLLQVKKYHEEFTQSNTISVARAVATSFALKNYQDVYVSSVQPKDVALDLVEVTYKEQYLSRSDMWRLRNSLVGHVMYLGKSVEHAGMRVLVEELWSKGDKVTCGYVIDVTRVTFRSSRAQVNIFLQMSCEMWQFDNYGDLYFEKTVQGYLVDLFSHWNEKNCTHDVTITMFSRTFYHAKDIEEFPIYMRDCIQQDYMGRFFEDFYRVVIQNERYDDWTQTMIQLKTLFNEYHKRVLRYHQQQHGQSCVPKARNSTAAEGNLLEVLNMALNIYEKFHLDRNFDRTGKLSIVITPGQGVFEVDRDLTHITKQRTIDIGASCDLVCMGEQPLHVSPLFKFNNKIQANRPDVGDDYNIPHWMNHSFYTSRLQQEKMAKKNKFIPRIQLPVLPTDHKQSRTSSQNSVDLAQNAFSRSPYLESEGVPFVNYDAYDAQVFKVEEDKNRLLYLPEQKQRFGSETNQLDKRKKQIRQREHSSNSMSESLLPSNSSAKSQPIDIVNKDKTDCLSYSYGGIERPFSYTMFYYGRKAVGSCCSPVGYHSNSSLSNYRPKRALINPFAPSRLHFRVTPNRRRWVHAFPTDLRGLTIQLHHHNSGSFSSTESSKMSPVNKQVQQASQIAVEWRRQKKQSECSNTSDDLSLSQQQQHMTGRSKQVPVNTVAAGYESGGEGGTTSRRVPTQVAMVPTHQSSDSTISTGSDRETALSTSGGMRQLTYPLSRSSSVHRDTDHITKQDTHKWMFGVTGEQEWTPQVHTGMDWKSLTMPASLPITTDFFPDPASLHKGYLINQYTLLPEDINIDVYHSNMKSLTSRQVYDEMVYQRISQGFQIVSLPKASFVSELFSSGGFSSSPYQSSSLMRKSKQEATEETVLSIGTIFHKITLSGPSINVTILWPKHPCPEKRYHYTYRFQVPDSVTYDVSWTEFKNDKLEKFNWNHLDQYICTKGEDYFKISETEKYWRSRFFLLPCNNPATKQIIEGGTRCDIYSQRSAVEQTQLTDGFLRFLEAINKIRRPVPSRMPKSSEREMKRRVSLPVSPMAGSFAVDKPSIEHMSMAARNVTKTLDFPDSPHTGSNMVGTLRADLSVGQRLGESLNMPGSPGTETTRLTTSSSHTDIIEAMMEPSDGLNFLTQQQGHLSLIPSHCFVAAEAVSWVMTRVIGVQSMTQAIHILQTLTRERYICHSSGNVKQEFVTGFYLFCILYNKEKKKSIPLGSSTQEIYAFLNEWCEVQVHHKLSLPHDKCPVFLLPRLPYDEKKNGKTKKKSSKTGYLERGEMKDVFVDVDCSGHSDRTEWGSALYHTHYHPHAAFELELQWLVATGCILGELVSGWARKASQNGFHFLPVPGDPFALPFTPNSDPLRGPIFVPLNVDILKQGKEHMFEDFPPESREDRMLLFKDSILKRFGFMPDKHLPLSLYPSSSQDESHPSYVHCSGGMFAMIPDNRTDFPSNQDSSQHGNTVTCGSHNQGVTKKALDQSSTSPPPQTLGMEPQPRSSGYYRDGFLWSWNFMLTKRWRSSNTGDEAFQDKMLADFRSFCTDEDGRLLQYWEDCANTRETCSDPQNTQTKSPEISQSDSVCVEGTKGDT